MLFGEVMIEAYGGGRSWSCMGPSTVRVSEIKISFDAADSASPHKIINASLFNRMWIFYLTGVSENVGRMLR